MPKALDVQDLRKVYRLYRSPKDRLLELISLKGGGHHREFPALDGASFTLDRGETLGVIGRNGSGKSTLLKILCGVTRPTSGTVEVSGRVASLLELGAGFHPEFSGRDNVYMNGSLMGFNKSAMDRRLPEIEAFAEIGEFIDQPVKRYSSGMFVRLAFSAAISVEPDILIIDEALGVGDLGFQLKCIEKLKAFQREGRTIILVTHQFQALRNFCTRVLWLDQGKIRGDGDVITVTDAYRDFMSWGQGAGQEAATEDEDSGGSVLSISSVDILDRNVRKAEAIEFGAPFSVAVSYRLHKPYEGLVGGVAIVGREGVTVCGLTTKRDGISLPSVAGSYTLNVSFPEPKLLPGAYRIRVVFLESSGVGRIAVQYDAASFTVRSTGYKAEGLYLLAHHWTVNALSDADVKR
ncbi:MAG: ABC transporter ATP-binding protein [Nitrospirota bacterium]